MLTTPKILHDPSTNMLPGDTLSLVFQLTLHLLTKTTTANANVWAFAYTVCSCRFVHICTLLYKMMSMCGGGECSSSLALLVLACNGHWPCLKGQANLGRVPRCQFSTSWKTVRVLIECCWCSLNCTVCLFVCFLFLCFLCLLSTVICPFSVVLYLQTALSLIFL